MMYYRDTEETRFDTPFFIFITAATCDASKAEQTLAIRAQVSGTRWKSFRHVVYVISSGYDGYKHESKKVVMLCDYYRKCNDEQINQRTGGPQRWHLNQSMEYFLSIFQHFQRFHVSTFLKPVSHLKCRHRLKLIENIKYIVLKLFPIKLNTIKRSVNDHIPSQSSPTSQIQS